MTLNGAIMELTLLWNHSMMPEIFKPSLEKIIETVSECEESTDVPHWIPCSERLPHAEDKVLCCTMTKKGIPNIVIGYYIHRDHGSGWACGMNSNVVAWMPLPEPYKEEAT